MSGVEPGSIEIEQDHTLDQWWTNAAVARWLVEWARLAPGMHVIEPAAGAGAIAREIPHDVHLTCVEIDLRLEKTLRWIEAKRPKGSTRVVIGDALQLDWSPRFDVGITNPPYSKPVAGIDSLFAAKMFSICDRVVLLVSESFFHTRRRYERVWQHCRLTRVAHFVDRLTFTVSKGAPGPITDYVAVELVPGAGPSFASHEWVYGLGRRERKGVRDARV